MNEPESKNTSDLVAFAEVIKLLPAVSKIIIEKRSAMLHEECQKLMEKCQELFRAEVCAIFIVRDGMAELGACRGYTNALGTPIDFETLHRALRYRVDPPGKSEDDIFDGITGWVASIGKEFCANSWEEVKRHKSHAGKPDKLRIWDSRRPFRCMFALPLKLRGKTIGVLKVENKYDPEQRGITFNETDKMLLRTLGACFLHALEYARNCFRQMVEEKTEPETYNQWYALPPTFRRARIEDQAARFDNSNMAEIIKRTPEQIEIALDQEIPLIHWGSFNQVFIAGMGGSAFPAEVVMDAFAERLKVPVKVIRHYTLPSSVDERSLVIVSSFSGNTEEILSVIERFPDKVSNVVVVSAGGQLTALANGRHYPLIEIPLRYEPKGFQPRSALGYFVTYFARLLTMANVMEDSTTDLEAVPRFLREVEIRPDAEDFAIWLKPRIPVVYTDEIHLMSIARIAKIKFNENSKRPAFFNAIPEANHNEMIGFSNKMLGKFGVLYLHDPDSFSLIRDRFYVMERVFMQENLDHVAFREWKIPGETKVQKIFAALMFADWCSYTLALLDDLDPTPVAVVESFKKALVPFRAE